MSTLTNDETIAVYEAAYRGLTDEQFRRHGLDVVLFEDGDARPISSGTGSMFSSGMVILENVSESDFGDWNPEEMTEEEFGEYCLDAFGQIEV